jgi:hypothetical protein
VRASRPFSAAGAREFGTCHSANPGVTERMLERMLTGSLPRCSRSWPGRCPRGRRMICTGKVRPGLEPHHPESHCHCDATIASTDSPYDPLGRTDRSLESGRPGRGGGTERVHTRISDAMAGPTVLGSEAENHSQNRLFCAAQSGRTPSPSQQRILGDRRMSYRSERTSGRHTPVHSLVVHATSTVRTVSSCRVGRLVAWPPVSHPTSDTRVSSVCGRARAL